jgi:hypothetical protein
VVGYADKAGYPVLEMQSGYQFTFTANSNFGQPGFAPNHDPYGVALIGAPDSESTLLRIAYGMEQQLNTQTQQSITQNTTEGNIVYTDAHVAPSVYNPAMFRCVAGSVYYAPYNCHPGEIGYVSPVTAPVEPSAATTGSDTSTSPGTSGASGGSATAPASSNAGPSPADLGAFVDAIEKVDLRTPLKTIVTHRTAQIKVGDTFVEPGTVTYHLELVIRRSRVVLTTTTRTFTSAGLKTVVIKLSTSARRLLNRHPTAGLILHTRFVGKPTGKAIATDRLYRRHR